MIGYLVGAFHLHHFLFCGIYDNNMVRLLSLRQVSTKELWVLTSSILHHLFSMSVCTLWTKSRAIIKTWGTLCLSAISEKKKYI